jgi:hypothetical protein
MKRCVSAITVVPRGTILELAPSGFQPAANTTVVDSDNLSLLWQWFSGVRDGEANIGLEA